MNRAVGYLAVVILVAALAAPVRAVGETTPASPPAPVPAALPPPERAEIPLTMEYADRLPAMPFPVTCGVPFRRGELGAVRQLALIDSKGRQVQLQARALNNWEDGSVKWALLDFMASSQNTTADRPYRLIYGSQSQPAPFGTAFSGFVFHDQFTVSTGKVTVEFGRPGERDLVKAIYVGQAKQPIARQLRCSYATEGALGHDVVSAVVSEVRLEESGKVRLRYVIEGRMIGRQGRDWGGFRMGVELWDGSGLMRLSPEMLLDSPTDQRPEISRLELTARTDLAHDSLVMTPYTGPIPLGRQVSLDQSETQHFTLSAPKGKQLAQGETADGWLDAQGLTGGIAVFVPSFAALFPQELNWRDHALQIELFAPTGQRPTYQPPAEGAVRRQALLYLHEEPVRKAELEQIWQAVQQPPRLFEPAWFRDMGAPPTASGAGE